MSILRRKKFLKEAWQKATYSKQQTSNQMPPPENTTKIQINLTQKKPSTKQNYITIPKSKSFPNIQTFTQAKHNGNDTYTSIYTQHIYKRQTSIINTNTYTSQMAQLKTIL